MNSKYARSARVYVLSSNTWSWRQSYRILEYSWRVQPWRGPGKFLSSMGIRQEHDRVFVRWPEQLYFLWFMLSAQRMCFAWVKKFTHFVVTSNSPHSVLTEVFGIITTKRFLFVWPVSSEVVNTARTTNWTLRDTYVCMYVREVPQS